MDSSPGERRRREVSVVIPAFNAGDVLATAIDSVLEQTSAPLECIVVDDGSTDSTPEVAGSYGPSVRVVQQANRGAAAARNRGARIATGELIAFLDADDRWRPERLEGGIETLVAQPQFDAVMCATEVVDSELRQVGVIRQNPKLTAEDLLLCRDPLVSTGSNLLITRECFGSVGGFDETLPSRAGAEDWLMIFRLVERGALTTIPDVLVQYRVHEGNASVSASRLEADMLAAFDRIYSGSGQVVGLSRYRRRAYANLHRMLAGAYYVEGRRSDFFRNFFKSIGWHPSTLPYFLKTPLRRRGRGSRPLDPYGLTGTGLDGGQESAGGTSK
jgi:glycosyltransferase involved in cell wall biosynthesis